MQILNITYPRLEIEPTICRVSNHTLAPLRQAFDCLNFDYISHENLNYDFFLIFQLGRSYVVFNSPIQFRPSYSIVTDEPVGRTKSQCHSHKGNDKHNYSTITGQASFFHFGCKK